MGLETMKITIDPDSDTAFVILGETIDPGGAPHSHICDLELHEGAVILLFSPDDRLVGLEILGASRVLPPEILARSAPHE